MIPKSIKTPYDCFKSTISEWQFREKPGNPLSDELISVKETDIKLSSYNQPKPALYKQINELRSEEKRVNTLAVSLKTALNQLNSLDAALDKEFFIDPKERIAHPQFETISEMLSDFKTSDRLAPKKPFSTIRPPSLVDDTIHNISILDLEHKNDIVKNFIRTKKSYAENMIVTLKDSLSKLLQYRENISTQKCTLTMRQSLFDKAYGCILRFSLLHK
ncbi:hypothetical protein [Biostraticola tofi]|uniref:Uncharacterized protein n=1 Tax=Biostraticola tofi TaxID=466109 RepID=A0A4R3YKD6_9GAMM|nr:hypothetical protein [Biostraticola tofi]TCV91494.1 hypothetical protein EDC52_11718 [Biostraticola tofi]